MRHSFLVLGLGLTLALALAGCNLAETGNAEDNASKPATEATVIGIWRSEVAVGSTPPTIILLTMQVDAAGSMVLSQRVATGQPAPYDYVEIAKENWSWKVENGSMLSVKTTCEYKDPLTMQTMSTTCADPLTKSAAINVKGSAWTVVENGQPVIFRKD